jgi:hypothetical protein
MPVESGVGTVARTSASPIGEASTAIIPMPLKRSVPPASSEADQLVVDGLVLSMPPSSARKS